MTSIISIANNTNKPLNAGQMFQGIFELVNSYTALSVAIQTDGNGTIYLLQSADGLVPCFTQQFNFIGGDFFNQQVEIFYKYCRIEIIASTNQTYIEAMTRWASVVPLVNEISVADLSLASGSNTIGNIGISPLLNTVKLDPDGNNIVTINDGQLPLGIYLAETYNNVVKINDPLPSGSNTIGTIGISPLLNTVQLDPSALNTVTINDGQLPLSVFLDGVYNSVVKINDPLPTGSNTIGTVNINGLFFSNVSVASVTLGTSYTSPLVDVSNCYFWDYYVKVDFQGGVFDTVQFLVSPDGITFYPYGTGTIGIFNNVASLGVATAAKYACINIKSPLANFNITTTITKKTV